MQYPGGKGRAYQRLISLIPPHRVYIETHLGGGAVMRNKRPASVSIGVEIDPAVVNLWAASPMPEVLVRQADAASFLRAFHFQGDEFVYCDPPYVPATRRGKKVYRFEYDVHGHTELLAALKALPCAVMISGYRSRLYASELLGWRSHSWLDRSHAGPAVETVWMNYPPPRLLHDHAYLGENFRDREAIRRRREGYLSRVRDLPAVERNAIIAELIADDPESAKRILESCG